MNNQELQADLAKVAAEYNHSVLQQAVLENYKDSILLLRAKYASYEKIAELLHERDIKVSVATVRKFCRKYQEEALRLRAEIESDAVTEQKPTPQLCDLTIDGADGGLKRGNTPMMVKECYDGREDRSWEKVPS